MSEPLPSSQDALAGIWKGLRDLSKIMGEPIPGEGSFVIVDRSEHSELRRIESEIRCAKLSYGDAHLIRVGQFNGSLGRLGRIREGCCDE